MTLRIGTAGWSVPTRYAEHFASTGSHLARYAQVLNCVEINSSFYRHHRRESYARWSESTPADFDFSVKTPKVLTHGGKLDADNPALERFAGEVSGLGPKLAVLLVQLPPSLAFDALSATEFFGRLKSMFAAQIACEPRHISWGSPEADALLQQPGTTRVRADPPRWPNETEREKLRELTYFRLHGAPRTYYSDYKPEQIQEFSRRIAAAQAISGEVWCIFDNTALGHALGNALTLQSRYI